MLSTVDENPEASTLAPRSVGGSPVLLQIDVDDPDAVAQRMLDRGGAVVFPIADQFYGRREGRLVDPFGHIWIVGKDLEALEPDEIRRRLARLAD